MITQGYSSMVELCIDFDIYFVQACSVLALSLNCSFLTKVVPLLEANCFQDWSDSSFSRLSRLI